MQKNVAVYPYFDAELRTHSVEKVNLYIHPWFHNYISWIHFVNDCFDLIISSFSSAYSQQLLPFRYFVLPRKTSSNTRKTKVIN